MTRNRITGLAVLFTRIHGALAGGEPLVWHSDGARTAYTRMLREAGLELVTLTEAKRRGHRLKRRAKPVASAWWGPPIKRMADLYVFGVQTTTLERAGQ